MNILVRDLKYQRFMLVGNQITFTSTVSGSQIGLFPQLEEGTTQRRVVTGGRSGLPIGLYRL